MAINSTLSPTAIAREALRLLKNNLVMGSNVYRDYQAEFPGDPKKGGNVTIRKPVKFTSTKARTRSTSVITENSITLSVSTQDHISWAFESAQLALTIEQYSERYLRPACARLANDVDADLLALYDDVYNSVWESTGHVTPNTFMVIGKAMQRLDEEACPPEDRVVVFNPAAHWSMANALTALYQQEPGTKAIRKGYLGQIAGAQIFMDQNVKVHTTGQYGTTAGSDGTGLEVATGAPTGVTFTSAIALCDFNVVTTAALKVGDVFTLAGIYAVNPMSGESTGALRNFVVTAEVPVASAGSGTEHPYTVGIQPDMIHTGPYKTVQSLPSGGVAVDVYGNTAKNYPQNLCFHKNAFALVMVPLPMPEGAWGATMSEDGFSIRITKQWSIETDCEVCRLDILYGVKTIYPELACRIWGAEA